VALNFQLQAADWPFKRPARDGAVVNRGADRGGPAASPDPFLAAGFCGVGRGKPSWTILADPAINGQVGRTDSGFPGKQVGRGRLGSSSEGISAGP